MNGAKVTHEQKRLIARLCFQVGCGTLPEKAGGYDFEDMETLPETDASRRHESGYFHNEERARRQVYWQHLRRLHGTKDYPPSDRLTAIFTDISKRLVSWREHFQNHLEPTRKWLTELFTPPQPLYLTPQIKANAPNS